MWFWFSILTLLFWSGSDLFSKIGCQDSSEKLSYLKMVTAVGLVMGLHAAFEIFFNGVEISFEILLTYLPVSLLYISSMAIGYLGLRFIELSISSPICNSSGAIVAVLYIAVSGFSPEIPVLSLLPVSLICLGVICLGITEANEDDELRRARQEKSNHYYAKSVLAIAIPVIYCLLDALGTFADSIVLERLDENSANAAYELTFLFAGFICFIILICKKQSFRARTDFPKLGGAVFETAGQFFYIFALADSEHVVFSAPIISAYCVLSVIWGRLFLKEKLSIKHYLSIFAVAAGIIILGILDI